MEYFPILIFVGLLVGLAFMASRAKRRAFEEELRLREVIQVGSEVMTTSGLYGTVVVINPDDTVLLSIAPGVEVKWAFAALRDIASLAERYQPGDEAAPPDLRKRPKDTDEA